MLPLLTHIVGKRNRQSLYSEELNQEVGSLVAEHGVDVEAAIPEGMREKAAQFEALGGEIYHESLPDEA